MRCSIDSSIQTAEGHYPTPTQPTKNQRKNRLEVRFHHVLKIFNILVFFVGWLAMGNGVRRFQYDTMTICFPTQQKMDIANSLSINYLPLAVYFQL